jgi:hypothetical protein
MTVSENATNHVAALLKLCQELRPVRRGDDGAFYRLLRDGDPSAAAVLFCPLGELRTGGKAEGLVELGRVSIVLPTDAKSVTAAWILDKLLVKISEGKLGYVEEAVAFTLDDFDKRFTYQAYGGLHQKGHAILYAKKADADKQKAST